MWIVGAGECYLCYPVFLKYITFLKCVNQVIPGSRSGSFVIGQLGNKAIYW